MFTNVNLTIMDNRFKIWMEHKQINASNLADNININKATISHILSGRNKPSIDFLTKLLKVYPNFNINWLSNKLIKFILVFLKKNKHVIN